MCPRVPVTLGHNAASRNWTTASEAALRCDIDILITPLLVTWLPGWYKCEPHEQRYGGLWPSMTRLHSSGLTQIV